MLVDKDCMQLPERALLLESGSMTHMGSKQYRDIRKQKTNVGIKYLEKQCVEASNILHDDAGGCNLLHLILFIGHKLYKQ